MSDILKVNAEISLLKLVKKITWDSPKNHRFGVPLVKISINSIFTNFEYFFMRFKKNQIRIFSLRLKIVKTF